MYLSIESGKFSVVEVFPARCESSIPKMSKIMDENYFRTRERIPNFLAAEEVREISFFDISTLKSVVTHLNLVSVGRMFRRKLYRFFESLNDTRCLLPQSEMICRS